MAMKPYKRAVCVTGTYQDRSGQEKKRYVSVGTLFQYDDGGFSLKLDSIPVGQGWNGFINFYDLEDNRQQGAGNGGGGGQQSRGFDETKPREDYSQLNDDIPF